MERPFGRTTKLDRLAKRMQRGDERAAEALYQELVGKTFGFCFNRLGNRQVAEDLTQEIFLKVVEKIDKFDENKGNFPVWFWRLARNTLIDYYREKKELAFSDLGEMAVIPDHAHNPEDIVEQRIQKKHLERFLETLTREEQEVFNLRYVSELSYREIADILEKNEGTLRVSVSRIKRKISEHLRSNYA